MNPLLKTITKPQKNTSVVPLHKLEDVEHTIIIEDLDLQVSIGILPEEKENKQRVLINLEISIEPKTDYDENIENTLSYADIIKDIENLVKETKHFNLVETLANDISDLCFSYNSVKKLFVCVKKPDIINNVKSVGFSMIKQK